MNMCIAMYFSLYLWCNEKSNFKQKISIIKRRSNVNQKNMLRKQSLNFDQWNKFSGNHKPISVLLWLVYKSIENNCLLLPFIELIQTRKMYPTYLHKIGILFWRWLVLTSQIFSCKLNSSRTYSLRNI